MSSDGPPRRALGWRVLLCVVAFAFAVRIGVGVWRGEDLVSAGNGRFYMDWLAKALAEGRGYAVDGVPNVFQQPAYVFALAAGYKVLGAGWPAVLAVNAVVGTALVVVTMRLARCLDRRAAVVAGLLAACHPVLVWHGLSVADTTLFSLALVGWADAVLMGLRRPGWWPRVLAGLWIGLASLTRPSLLPLLPVGLVAIAWTARSVRPALLSAATWFLVAALITAPWIVRNHELTGRFPLIGTHGPESVWAANTDESPRATELDSSYDAVSALHVGTEFDVRAFQVRVAPEEAVRRADAFRAATIEWVRAHPGTFAWMCAVRLGRMWDVRYHPTRRWERPLRGLAWRSRVHMATQVSVLLLALVGAVVLWLRGRRRPDVLLLASLLAVYSLAHCVGAGYSRVRMPVDPIVVAIAGCGAAEIVRLARSRGQSAHSGRATGDRR